jgi:triacylglycerol lipase
MLSTCAHTNAGGQPDHPIQTDTALAAVVTSPTRPLRYPIVLVHGFSGFASVGPLHYFHGVPEALRADGHDVWVAEVDPFNSSEKRGAELIAFVQRVLSESAAERVILLGHSQGGIDARFAAAALPDRIAAVVTIASPHRGCPVADVTLASLPSPLQVVATAVLDAFGVFLSGATGHQAHLAVQALSSAGMAEFNALYPDQLGVSYFSIAGRSNRAPHSAACESADEPELINRWRSFVDPTNPAFRIAVRALEAVGKTAVPHDGLVPVSSARWGTFLGCVPADHLDQICQLGGQSPGDDNPFDCLAFYRELAGWLSEQGY